MAVIPVPPVYLVSTDGQQWQLSCLNGGAPIHTQPVTGQTAFASILVNDIGMTQTWRLTIVPNPSPYMGVSPGDIHIDPVAYSATSPIQIMCNSPDGTLWWIQIDGGLLQTNLGTVGTCTPVVGSLYAPNFDGIAWSQPGGIGTIVFPQQNTGSFGYPGNQILMQEKGQGLWTSGCQHWWNCMRVARDYNYCTQQSIAVYLCPVCTYVINIVTPYEAIEDPIQFPILIP